MYINTLIIKSNLAKGKNSRGFIPVIAGLTVLLLFFGLLSCDFPAFPKEEGSLRVTIGSGTVGSRSLLPSISMDPAEYRISGIGPDGETFQAVTPGGDTDFEGLTVGQWVVSVSAFNAQADLIGQGVSNVLVESGTRSGVSVEVKPVSGTGSLSLLVFWPAAEAANPEISATLTGTDGQTVPLTFTMGAGEAVCSANGIASGYYTLNIQILDGQSILAGVVDTIRIVTGALTEGTYTFNDLNSPTGDVDIIVIIDLDEPLAVEMAGVAPVLPYGGMMTAVASVTNSEAAELVYAWYLNGAPAGTGPTVNVGVDLRRGSYRLDVVVFTADGSRSGTALHSFTVE